MVHEGRALRPAGRGYASVENVQDEMLLTRHNVIEG